jgi:hypothetical protein
MTVSDTIKPITSNLVVSSQGVSGIPGLALLAASALRGQSASLSGRIEDNRPGLGVPARDAVAGEYVYGHASDIHADLNSPLILTGEFTLHWFAKREHTLGHFDTIIGNDGGSAIVGYTTSQDSLFIRNNAGSSLTETNIGSTDSWHSLTVRRDSSNNLYLRVDVSAEVDLGTFSGTLTLDRLLNNGSLGANVLNGYLSDLQIFNSDVGESGAHQLATLGENALPNVDRLAWFKCDSRHETLLLDSSGNGNHATLSGHTHLTFRASSSDAPVDYLNEKGYSDYHAFSVAGSDYIEYSNAPSIDVGTAGESYTVSVRVVVCEDPSTGIVLCKADSTSGGNYPFYLYYSGSANGIALYLRDDGTPKQSGFADTTLGAATTLTMVVDRATNVAYSYQDGVYLDEIALTPGAGSQDIGPLNIARHLTGSSHFGGIIDNVRIWKGKALDASEVAALSPFVAEGSESFYLPFKDLDITETASGLEPSGYIAPATSITAPRDESNKSKDIYGNPLQYPSKAHKPMQLVDANCFHFDGTDDVVVIADDPAFDITDNLSAFIRTNNDSGAVGVEYILSKFAAAGSQREWAIGVNSSEKVQLLFSGNGSAFALLETDESYTWGGTPRTIGFTKSGTDVVIYVDGVVAPHTVSSGTIPATLFNGTADVVVGGVSDGAGGGAATWDGLLYDARVYAGDSDVLTAEQMLAVHNKTGVEFAGQELKVWLPCSEDAGNIAHNVADPTNNGVISGHTALTFFGTKQPEFHFNSTYGHSRRMNSLIRGSEPTTGIVKDAVTLANTTDPFGSNFALRILPSDLTTGNHRIYYTSNQMAVGQYLVAYAKQVGAGSEFGWTISSGNEGHFTFSIETISGSTGTVVSSQNIGNGWYKLVWKLSSVGTNVMQVHPSTGPSFTPASTADGCDFFIGVVDDWETQDIYPTTASTLARLNDRIPAAQDGSGLDTAGLPVMYPPYTDKLTVSESKVNMHPVAWPTRDWSLPVNLATTVAQTNGTNVPTGVIAPNGRPEGRKFTSTVTGQARVLSTLSSPSDGSYVVSAWAKDSNTDIVSVGARIDSAYPRVEFDLSDLSKTVQNSGATTITDSRITKVGDWYFLEAEMDVTWGTTNQTMLVGGAGFVMTNGDSFEFWNHQAIRGTLADNITIPSGFEDETPPTDWHPDPPELIEYSSEFDNAYWTVNTFVTVTANQDGVADELEADGGGTGVHGRTGYSIENGVFYRLGIKLKKGTSTDPRIRINMSSTKDVTLDWSGTAPLIASGDADFGWIEPVDADGFYEVVVVGKSVSTAASIYLYPSAANTAGANMLAKEISLKRYFPTNPLFHRQRTLAGKLVAVDRVTNYRQPLVGPRLAQAQQFTQTAEV